MLKKEFYTKLNELENKFSKMKPELEMTLRDPKLDVEGYVVVWNTDISVGGKLERCGKGGTRITPNLSLDEIKMLARKMALKNAAAGLPLGGAKSGMRADPDSDRFEERYKKFVSLCKPILFENGGIFGGFGFDIGAREIHPHWAFEALGSTKSFTGKPVDMGGTDYDKEGVAGLGVAVAGKTVLEIIGTDNINEVGFAVQGIGAMGAAVIKYFSEYGGKLLAISDLKVGGSWIFDKTGAPKDIVDSISIGDISKTVELLNSGDYQNIDSSEEVLYADVDILFPCALQDVVTLDNVGKIKAKYLVEGANSPCSKEVHTKLFEQETIVIPDFIANPGGIIAAYVELTSDASIEDNIKHRTKVQEAKTMTKERISENVKDVMKLALELDIEPVDAGMFIALKKILEPQVL